MTSNCQDAEKECPSWAILKPCNLFRIPLAAPSSILAPSIPQLDPQAWLQAWLWECHTAANQVAHQPHHHQKVTDGVWAAVLCQRLHYPFMLHAHTRLALSLCLCTLASHAGGTPPNIAQIQTRVQQFAAAYEVNPRFVPYLLELLNYQVGWRGVERVAEQCVPRQPAPRLRWCTCWMTQAP